MRVIFIFLLGIIFFIGCKNDKEMKFSDFVDVGKIKKVKIIKDSTSFTLSKEQLEKFKKDISSLQHDPSTFIIKSISKWCYK